MIKAGIKIIKKPGFHSVSQKLENQSSEAKLSWITRKSGLLKTKYKEIRGDYRLLHRTLLFCCTSCCIVTVDIYCKSFVIQEDV